MTIPKRYTLQKFVEALNDPTMFRSEINRGWDNIVHKVFYKRYYRRRYGKGIDVMEKDWDNLIILDACRHDVFKEVNMISGDLRAVHSQGSHSKEFIRNNFSGKEFRDTVYVTANVYGAQVEEGVFHDVIVSFDDDIDNPRHKDNRSPGLVRDLAIAAHREHPNKRLIIHFMQPHSPYFSETAEHLREFLRAMDNIWFRTWDGDPPQDSEALLFKDLNNAAEEGYLSPKLLRYLYKQNLEFVLNIVEGLIKKIDGKSIITADHGELLGESEVFFRPPRYNHPKNVYMKELRQVPWMVIDADERREIVTEPPNKKSDISTRQIDEQFRLLGYL